MPDAKEWGASVRDESWISSPRDSAFARPIGWRRSPDSGSDSVEGRGAPQFPGGGLDALRNGLNAIALEAEAGGQAGLARALRGSLS